MVRQGGREEEREGETAHAQAMLWTVVPNKSLSVSLSLSKKRERERTGKVAHSRHAARSRVSGGGKQAQLHHPASLSSESGESLRHAKCYSATGGWGSMKARGDAESVRGRRPRPPVMDHGS